MIVGQKATEVAQNALEKNGEVSAKTAFLHRKGK